MRQHGGLQVSETMMDHKPEACTGRTALEFNRRCVFCLARPEQGSHCEAVFSIQLILLLCLS